MLAVWKVIKLRLSQKESVPNSASVPPAPYFSYFPGSTYSYVHKWTSVCHYGRSHVRQRVATCCGPAKLAMWLRFGTNSSTWANVVRRDTNCKRSATRCKAMPIATRPCRRTMDSMRVERSTVGQRVATCRVPAKLACWLRCSVTSQRGPTSRDVTSI